MPCTMSVIVPSARLDSATVKRDAFAVLVNANDHKLAGLLLARNARSHDAEQFDVRCQEARFRDGKSVG